MQKVITEKQARAITGGRKPLVPVVYEDAVKALSACLTLDDAKYWDNKADALAAWAKIYRDDDAGRKARALKLRAYRRMGELAQEIRPKPVKREIGRGMQPGPAALLVENGLSPNNANAARRLAKLPRTSFEELANSQRPPTPTQVQKSILRGGSTSWKQVSGHSGPGLLNFRSWLRRHDAIHLAAGLAGDEIEKAREMARECIDWLDTFEQHLPKEKP